MKARILLNMGFSTQTEKISPIKTYLYKNKEK